jgi:hypothetical protein
MNSGESQQISRSPTLTWVKMCDEVEIQTRADEINHEIVG